MSEPATQPSVLLITRNLPPLRGGMERLIQHMAHALADRHDLDVIGPSGCGAYLPGQVRTHAVAYRPLPRFMLAAAIAIKHLKRRQFAFVVAGSGLTAPLAWWATRRTQSRLVVYLHGLDIIAPSRIYQHCWLPFIRRADLVLVNSRNTRRLAVEHGIPEQAIQILHPGTDLPGPDPDSGRAFRKLHGLGDRPLLLSVGRLTARKGLAEFIQRALPTLRASHPDVLLLVIGADAIDAVRPAPQSQQARIVRSINETAAGSAVRMLPPCDDATLSAAYRAADVHVFPVLDIPGDVEGFGMVAIEAAAHGLPTVAFDVGGVPDAVVEGISGNLVEAGNYAGFVTLVRHWLANRNQLQKRDACSAAVCVFGWDCFGEKLHIALRNQLRGAA